MALEDRLDLDGVHLGVAQEAIWEFYVVHERWPTVREAADFLAFYSSGVKDKDDAERLILAALGAGEVRAQAKEDS